MSAAPELSAVDAALWDEARRRLPLVRQIVNDPKRTRAQVSELAAALGRGVTQTYALLRRYQADPRLTSLLPQHRGPARGYSRLPQEIEALIEEVVSSFLPHQAEAEDIGPGHRGSQTLSCTGADSTES